MLGENPCGLKNVFDSSMVNEPLKFYCIFTNLWCIFVFFVVFFQGKISVKYSIIEPPDVWAWVSLSCCHYNRPGTSLIFTISIHTSWQKNMHKYWLTTKRFMPAQEKCGEVNWGLNMILIVLTGPLNSKPTTASLLVILNTAPDKSSYPQTFFLFLHKHMLWFSSGPSCSKCR